MPTRVSWSKEEDDILKQQVRIHGAPKWTAIAKALTHKTATQCRHRWYNYLNSHDVKTANWSNAEDNLLLESQKKLGNKWIKVLVRVRINNSDNTYSKCFI